MVQTDTKLGKETYRNWYELMLLLRRFEEKAGQMYGQQKIRGFCHLYIGQEAVAAGTISATRPNDPMITAYRDHGLAIAKGIPPKEIMAELFGKETGCSKGKGGSMHFFSKEHNFFGGHGIVGGQIPLGAGIAFAEQYKGTDNVCICFLGDGAARQGALYETFNMAMLWKLPVVFMIENNGYAMGTSVKRSSNVTELSIIGRAFEMPSYPVDGMKCEEVHTAVSEAVSRARKGDGPTLLDVKTYRYRGHSMSDPAKYRSKDEVEEYKTIDPLESTKTSIIAAGFADEAYFEGVEEKVRQIVEDSVSFAEESPFPPHSALYEHIYVQTDYPFIHNN